VLLAAGRPAAAAPAPGDRSSLAQVPATAPIVLYLRGAEAVKDRLLVTLKAALPELLPRIQPMLDNLVKDGIEGRKLAGVPKDGPIFLVFTELPKPADNPPKMAVVLAVNKYEEFRDALLKEDERKNLKSNGEGVERTTIDNREAVYFVDKKGYAVVSPSEEVANALAKKLNGLDGKMSKTQAAKMLSSDFALYANLSTVNKEYADQIKEAKEAVTKGLEQVGDSVGKAQKNGIEMAKKAIGPIFQAVEDSQGVLLTVDCRPGGFALHVQSELRTGSTTAGLLEGLKLSGFKDLDRMPGGQVFYTGIQTGGRMLEMVGALIQGAADPDSKEAKASAQAMEQLAKAGPGTRLDAASLPASGLQIWHFEDPAKAAAAQLKLMEAAEAGGSLQGGVIKAKPVIKKAAQKYGDFALNEVEITWDLDKMAEQAAGGRELPEESKKEVVEILKGKILGEKLTVWFGTDGKVNLQVTAKDWPAAEKILDRYFKGNKSAGDAAAFREVRKEMPAEASLVALVDAVQYAGVVVDLVKPIFSSIFPLPPGFPAKPDKDKPTYVGGAVTLQSERGSFDLFVSAGAVHEAYKAFVQPILPGN
jgi:hypothetical protein